MILSLSSCCLQHEWEDADCITPKTCSKCGKTEGKPLGHDWEDATCTEAKKCKRCGAEEGEPLGHTPGDWEVTEEPTPGLEGERTQYCAVCGEELATEEIEALPVASDGKFRISPKSFYLTLMMIIDDDLVVGDGTNDSGSYAVAIGNKSHDIISKILFASDDDEISFITEEDANEDEFNTIVVSIDRDYTLEFTTALESIIKVIDPSLTDSEINDFITNRVLQLMIDVYTEAKDTKSFASDNISKNGITYGFGVMPNGDLMTIKAE